MKALGCMFAVMALYFAAMIAGLFKNPTVEKLLLTCLIGGVACVGYQIERLGK